MFKVIMGTLTLSLFLAFVYDIVKYNIFKAKVKSGEFGAKYNTPRHIGEFISNMKFLISHFKQNWRV